MGLHQAIYGRELSVPCDCGADDDHSAFEVSPAVNEVSPVQSEDEERPAEPEGMTTTKSNED